MSPSSTVLRLLAVSLALAAPLSHASDPTCPREYQKVSLLQRTLDRFAPDLALRRRARAAEELGWFPRSASETIRRDLERTLPRVDQAMAENDPGLRFMQRLGIRVANGRFEVPPLSEVMLRVEDLVDHLPIAPQLKIYPASIYQLPDDSLVALRVGQKIPEGARIYQKLLSAEDFARFVGMGLFPVGAPEKNVNSKNARGGYSAFLHDLIGHCGALVEHPDFMVTTRQVNMRISRDRTRFRFSSGPDDPGENIDLLVRLNRTQEDLILTPTTQRPGVESLLRTFNIVPAERPLTLEQAHRAVSAMSEEALRRSVSEIQKQAGLLFEIYGGTLRDFFFRLAKQLGRLDPDDNAIQFTPLYLGQIISNPTKLGQLSAAKRRDIVSRYLTIIDHTSRISPSQWFNEVSHSGALQETGPVFQYICRSGVFTRRNFEDFWAYCGQR